MLKLILGWGIVTALGVSFAAGADTFRGKALYDGQWMIVQEKRTLRILNANEGNDILKHRLKRLQEGKIYELQGKMDSGITNDRTRMIEYPILVTNIQVINEPLNEGCSAEILGLPRYEPTPLYHETDEYF